MFVIDDGNGTIRLDYSKVDKIYKYGLIMKDGSELILPQTLIKKLKPKIYDFHSWERDTEGNIIR